MLEEPLPPPGQQAVHGGRAAQRQEAEVVSARLQDRELARVQLVLDRLGEVRREHDLVAIQELRELVERAEELDVGVEVDELLELARDEEVLEEERLHGRVHLEQRVAEEEGAQVGDLLERLDLDQLERLERRVEGALDAIHEQDEERRLGVLRAERARQHPREGQVVLRDDRAGGERAAAGGHGQPGPAAMPRYSSSVAAAARCQEKAAALSSPAADSSARRAGSPSNAAMPSAMACDSGSTRMQIGRASCRERGEG